MWIAGSCSSRCWNGGSEKWLLISLCGLASAATASGWPSWTVSGSSLVAFSGPKAFLAAIWSSTACEETFTEGRAILSLPEKSPRVFTSGLRVSSSIGVVPTPHRPFTSPRVRSLSSSMLVEPLSTMSILPESSASLPAAPLVRLTHSTATSPRPAALACFSISLCCSARTAGR